MVLFGAKACAVQEVMPSRVITTSFQEMRESPAISEITKMSRPKFETSVRDEQPSWEYGVTIGIYSINLFCRPKKDLAAESGG